MACGGTPPDNMQYTDALTDNDALSHFVFRDYSRTQGRWIVPDPAGIAAANVGNPQSLNQYAYVMGNPVTFTDPLGLYCPTVNVGPYASRINCSPDSVGLLSSGTAWGGFLIGVNTPSGLCGSDFLPCGLPTPGPLQSIWSDVLGLPSGLDCPVIGGLSSFLCGGINPIMDTEAENNGTPCLAGAGPLAVGQSRCGPQPPLGNSWSHPFTPPTCQQWKNWGKADAYVAGGSALVAKKYPVTAPVAIPVAEVFGFSALLENGIAWYQGCFF